MTHPLVALARKRMSQPLWFWFFWVVWWGSFAFVEPLVWFLGTTLAPLALAAAGSGVMHSGLVEQLEGTPTSAAGGVDALAWETTRRSLLPALMVGIAGGAFWGLALLLVAPTASFLAQAGRAWSVADDDLILRHVLSWPTVLAGGLLTGFNPLLGGLALLLGFRTLALAGLARADSVRRSWRVYWQARRPRRDGWSLWDLEQEGPIIYRQVTRHALPGFLGLLWRHGLALVLLPALILALAYLPLTATTLFTLCLCLVVVQTARALTSGLGSMVEERDGRTLEGLLTTLLEPQEWLGDWARLIWVPRMFENLAFAAVLLGAAVLNGIYPWRLLLCLVVLASLTLSSTYLGLWISTAETDRARATDRAGFELLAWVWLPAVLALLGALAAPFWLAPWPALGCPLQVGLFRRQALSSLSAEAVALEELEARLGRELQHRGSAEAVIQFLETEFNSNSTR